MADNLFEERPPQRINDYYNDYSFTPQVPPDIIDICCPFCSGRNCPHFIGWMNPIATKLLGGKYEYSVQLILDKDTLRNDKHVPLVYGRHAVIQPDDYCHNTGHSIRVYRPDTAQYLEKNYRGSS